MRIRFKASIIFFLLVSAVFIFTGIRLHAENISDRIQLNGFLSQGYVYTTDNDFIPQSSQNGSFEFNEFAITVSADASKKLRLGFQLLARDFGRIGNHQIKLDWGFADYRVSNAFGVRVGKVKTPFGLFNEFRDTDALFPTVILPQSIYDESMRAVFISYNGIGFTGNLNIGAGSLNYHLFCGGVNHPPEETPYVTQVQTAINTGLKETGMSISSILMDTQLFFGGRLIWKTPLNGLKMGGSFVHLKTKFNSMLNIPGMDSQKFYGHMNIKKGFFLFCEWAIGNLTFTSEYMELPVDISIDMLGEKTDISKETMQGWYVMGTYLLGDKFTLYSYYDRFYADKGDTTGISSVKLGNPNYFAWQKDWVIGFRFDVNFNWTIKAEWHSVDGLSKSYVFNDDWEHTKQKWNMIAAKLSYNF